MESNALASAYETDELPLLYPAIKLCLYRCRCPSYLNGDSDTGRHEVGEIIVSLSLIFEWGQHNLIDLSFTTSLCRCPSYLNGDNTFSALSTPKCKCRCPHI